MTSDSEPYAKDEQNVKQMMVSYRVKPDRADENADRVRRVFTELARDRPDGLRYAAFRQNDGVSFVHLASIETADGSSPLPNLAAFQAFTEEISERCDEPPVAVELEPIGSYRFFPGLPDPQPSAAER
jgi:hypothetical protein